MPFAVCADRVAGRPSVKKFADLMRGAGWAAALSLGCASGSLSAQEMPEAITPPEVTMDANGLNLLNGQMARQRPTMAIPAAPRLTFSRASDFFLYSEGSRIKGRKVTESPTGTASNGGYAVHYGGMKSERFSCQFNFCSTGNSYSKMAALTGTFNPRNRVDQAKTGVTYNFDQLVYSYEWFNSAGQTVLDTMFMAGTVVYPDGEILTFEYEAYNPGGQGDLRPHRVRSNIGYYLEFSYWDSLGTSGWARIKTASIYSNSAPGVPRARLSYTSDGGEVSDMEGQVWKCPSTSKCGSWWGERPWAANDSVVLPGQTNATITFAPTATQFLAGQLTKGGDAWTYEYLGLQEFIWMSERKAYKYDSVKVTNPDGSFRTYNLETETNPSTYPKDRRYVIQYVKSVTDELGRTTTYQYDCRECGAHYEWFVLSGVTFPEGNSVEYDYDSSGNIVKQTAKAKPGTGAADLIEEIAYVGCNLAGTRIAWHRDARGNQSDYEYNASCQPTVAISPADANGQRLRTVNEYEAHDTGSGVISRLIATYGCVEAGGACGASVGKRTEFEYLADTFLVTEMREIDPGTGEVLRTCRSYDDAGRLISETSPRAGLSICQ